MASHTVVTASSGPRVIYSRPDCHPHCVTGNAKGAGAADIVAGSNSDSGCIQLLLIIVAHD